VRLPGSARYFSLSLTLLLSIFSPSTALAQSANFEGLPIISITYDPPAQPLDPSDLARVQILNTGASYHAADAAALIDELYATGRYRDVQIDATSAANGVAIRVITSNNWFVGHIAVNGKISAPPSREELTDVTRLDLGKLFAEKDVADAQENLHRLLERNGLYEHSIRVETNDRPEIQQRNVTFIVTMGPRAKYDMPVIGGDTKLPNETIVRATGWRIRFIGWWRKVTQERTRNGINGILKKYQKEDRLTAKATLESSEYEPSTRRLKPKLDIEAGPKISIQAVETKVSQRTLKRYVPVFQEQTLDRDLLVEGSRNLRDYFQSKGYFETQVDFRIREQDPDHTLVEYEVVRGMRHKLVRVDITGNHYFSTDVIRERMFLQPSSFRLRHGRYSEDFVRKDAESITNLYKSNGFRDVKVTPVVQDDYRGVAGDVAVRIEIDEGPQFYVSSLNLEGVVSLDPGEILGHLGSTKGQPFSETTIAADQDAVLTEYYRQGFPDVSFRWSVTSSASPTQLDLVYNITEGSRQFVRDVITSGIHITRQRILNQNLRIAPGDPLSLVALSEAQRNLYQLGLFSKVDMAIQNQDGKTERKHILYDFEESSRYNVALGIGAEIARIGGSSSDLSTPAGSTGFSPRFSVDVSRLNLFGTGHSVSLRGRVSNLEQLASINYLAPRFHNVE